MIHQNPILNMLTFTHPVGTAEFSFLAEEADGLFFIHQIQGSKNNCVISRSIRMPFESYERPYKKLNAFARKDSKIK